MMRRNAPSEAVARAARERSKQERESPLCTAKRRHRRTGRDPEAERAGLGS